MRITKDFSLRLANEIAQRNIYDTDEVATLIKVNIESELVGLIRENAEKVDLRYQEVLQRIAKTRIGSKEYVELGYQLSRLKHEKKAMNKAADKETRDRMYSRLRTFIIDRLGEEFLNDFYDEINKK